MKAKLQIFFELTKIRITSFVTLTAIFGYICFSPKLHYNLAAAVLGILVLACGSAVINHIQEHKIDSMMERTKYRPIPSNRISIKNASIIAAVLAASGLTILFFVGTIPFILGLLNLIWYNLVYTPLKRVSQIAILPGALVGAIPPAIGWTAAGGSVFDTKIIVISFFFFIWQIPHFWLLLLTIGKDYKKAGLPTLTNLFSFVQLSRITFIWIVATVVTSLLLPFFGIIQNPFLYVLLLLAGCWITWNTSKFLYENEFKMNFKFAFREINVFALLVMIIISLDQIIVLL